MDVFTDKFMPALKLKDFVKAEAALEEFKLEETNTHYMWAKSLLYYWKKQLDKANEILSEIIDKGEDQNKICQHTRAENYLNDRQYIKALADLNAILSDNTPKTVEIYHEYCWFIKAFILASLGEHEFNDVIQKIDNEFDTFVIDGMYDKPALIRIYNANKKPIRAKPRLE